MIGSLIMGALVGWIAARLMGAKSGLLRNIITGIAGAALGSAICRIAGFYVYGWFAQLLVSVGGACLFIWIGRRLFR